MLEFKKENVLVFEKYISTCNSIAKRIIGNFKWVLLPNNKIEIQANTKEIEYTILEKLKDLSLQYSNRKLIGKMIHNDNSINECHFLEKLD